MDKQSEQKKAAAIYAANLIEDNMIVGLGTGSTASFFVEALAKRIKEENFKIKAAVTTSIRTAELAKGLGIEVLNVDEVDHVDLTVDGADEVDDQLNGIKGGGAALLFEKIVAKMSKKNIWIVDPSKQSQRLGSNFLLPIEVVQFGSQHVFNFLKQKGLNPQYRLNNEQYLETDSNNYIIDVKIPSDTDLYQLADELKSHTGIVEHGLFLDICDQLIIGGEKVTIKDSQ